MADQQSPVDERRRLSPEHVGEAAATSSASYEQLLDLRARMERDTREGETFVWTDEPPRTAAESSLLATVRERLR